MTYKKKLLINFISIFSVFTLLIILFQYNRERTYRMEYLKSNLSVYATLLSHSISVDASSNSVSLDTLRLNELLAIMPEPIRVTLIKKNGDVFYDNVAQEEHLPMENHKNRPEIRDAMFNKWGYSIRKSETTHQNYYYYSSYENSSFVRVALPFDVDVDVLLMADNLYIYVIMLLFFGGLFSILYVSNKMGDSLSLLRDYAINPRDNYDFPQDELGQIGRKIKENYDEIKKRKEQIKRNEERMKMHFVHSSLGVAFFSKNHDIEYANVSFISNLNVIAEEPFLSLPALPEWNVFDPVRTFLQNEINKEEITTYEYKIDRNEHFFHIRVLRFIDGGYECILNDITTAEKTSVMKHEITANIAHELRTPVSSISGYLETIIAQPNIPEATRMRFIERSFNQAKRLSSLIRDIALITQIDKSNISLTCQTQNLYEMIESLRLEYAEKIANTGATLHNKLPEDIMIYGNETLLLSIFSNLIDNALNYAKGSEQQKEQQLTPNSNKSLCIYVEKYFEDDQYYYFTVWDNGKGVEEGSLLKLFDRFYRPSEGRTRTDGGSGLGLSIVKHAVQFHKGDVLAKNRISAGLEVSFSLKKNCK